MKEEVSISTMSQNGTVSESNSSSYNMEIEDPDAINVQNQCCCIHMVNQGTKIVSERAFMIKRAFLTLLLILFIAFVIYSMTVKFGDEPSIRLLVCTIFGLFILLCKYVKKMKCFESLGKSSEWHSSKQFLRVKLFVRWSLYLATLILLGLYIGLDIVANQHYRNLVSLGGTAVYIFILFLMSNNKRKIQWHIVFWGLTLQFVFGLIVLRTSWGVDGIQWVSNRITEFIHHTDFGSAFLFGSRFKEFPIIFGAFPQVVTFCAAIFGLSYLGVLEFIIKYIGGFLGYCLNTSAVESINAASNIFMGGIESLMVVSDHIPKFTESQMYCMFVNGMSSLAGVAIIFYSSLGVPMNFLLGASVMSAPAALVAAKITFPSEDISTDSKQKNIKLGQQTKAKDFMSALYEGGMKGAEIVMNIIVNLLIYLTAFTFVNSSIEWFGLRAGLEEFTLETIFSYVLWPFAFIMGVDQADCLRVGRMLGIRTVANLAISFMDMGLAITNKEKLVTYSAAYNDTVFKDSGDIFLPQWNATLESGIVSDRSEMIGTYALCGFASIPSIGILLGAFAVIAPSRIEVLKRHVLKAFVASTIASYLTACVAGTLYY